MGELSQRAPASVRVRARSPPKVAGCAGVDTAPVRKPDVRLRDRAPRRLISGHGARARADEPESDDSSFSARPAAVVDGPARDHRSGLQRLRPGDVRGTRSRSSSPEQRRSIAMAIAITLGLLAAYCGGSHRRRHQSRDEHLPRHPDAAAPDRDLVLPRPDRAVGDGRHHRVHELGDRGAGSCAARR